jgi:hypothetical protein
MPILDSVDHVLIDGYLTIPVFITDHPTSHVAPSIAPSRGPLGASERASASGDNQPPEGRGWRAGIGGMSGGGHSSAQRESVVSAREESIDSLIASHRGRARRGWAREMGLAGSRAGGVGPDGDRGARQPAILIQRENPVRPVRDECSDAVSEPRNELCGRESRKLCVTDPSVRLVRYLR